MRNRIARLVIVTSVLGVSVCAQQPATGPAPRMPDGKPDLSGVWQKIGDRYANSIAADLAPGEITAWADAIYQTNRLGFGKDAPGVRCLPRRPLSDAEFAGQARSVPTFAAHVPQGGEIFRSQQAFFFSRDKHK